MLIEPIIDNKNIYAVQIVEIGREIYIELIQLAYSFFDDVFLFMHTFFLIINSNQININTTNEK